MPINAKLIAKNTLYLYFRLILIALVSLYMSRVLLDKLGEVDYGLYHVVYGVIGMVSFLSGTLSTCTSRFITYALGTGDSNEMRRTFSTAFVSHLALAGIMLILGETIGLWYAHHVMVVPPERLHAAMIVYQVSIISTVTVIIQVPFSAAVIAHERMNAYAVVGIFEALAKLLIVFLLTRCSFDKLIFYAFLGYAVTFGVFCTYVTYARKSFEEVSFSLTFDKPAFRGMMKFSAWNIVANLSNTLMGQGVIMLFNLFFAPVVVAAQAIAGQVYTALNQLGWNVRNAVNPQIIKLFADDNQEESSHLTYVSAEGILYLTMMFSVPCIMVMPTLLNIWLVDVPEYAVAFARLLVLQLILDNYSASYYAPMLAANKVAFNSLAALVLCVFQFVAMLVLFKIGLGPLWARYLGILTAVIFSFVVKPYVLCKDIGYRWQTMLHYLWRGIRLMLVVGGLNLALYHLIPQDTIWQSAIVMILSVLIVLASSWVFMEATLRRKVMSFVKQKLAKK